MAPVDENSPQYYPQNRKRANLNALKMGPRKKACFTDPLIHHGRHFGRTVHALCNVHAVVTAGILRSGELADLALDDFTSEERRTHQVYNSLLNMVPGLEERLMESSQEEIRMITDLVQKGASHARSDDTKSLKSAILDWIVPRGQSLNPPIHRNVKLERGFHHQTTGALLCPAGVDWSDSQIRDHLRNGTLLVSGDQWPALLYKDLVYSAKHPWDGLFRNIILVYAYKFIFTSPSSVEKEAKATRSGNARIHGMTRVTPASIAYASTQARFALSSSPTFTRTDTTTDSERFYNSVLEFLEDPEEQAEVNDLFVWWNRQVFPSFSIVERPATQNSALAAIRARRVALRALENGEDVNVPPESELPSQ